MSYEKKMKDLLGRLVSMTPEPPPYPEEAPMARHAAKRSFSPVLVFLGAAAVVTLLAVPLILWTGGEEPGLVAASSTTSTVPGTSTSLAATTSTEAGNGTTTTVGETTTTDAPMAAVSWTGPIYLVQSPENSFLGNPALVPIIVEANAAPGILDEHAEFTRFLTALDASGQELPPGLDNAIPEGVIVRNQTETSDGATRTYTVDMSEEFLAGAGGLLADFTMLNQLIYTLTESHPDSEILFTVNDGTVESFGSEGLDLTEPVDRETFIDELNPIFLTDPVFEVEEVYLVAGRSNTFEASLVVQVIDASGTAVLEEFVTASCGSGCWGEFGVGLDSDRVIPGESSIRLLSYSAEDGAPTDVITVPIPEGQIWRWNLEN